MPGDGGNEETTMTLRAIPIMVFCLLPLAAALADEDVVSSSELEEALGLALEEQDKPEEGFEAALKAQEEAEAEADAPRTRSFTMSPPDGQSSRGVTVRKKSRPAPKVNLYVPFELNSSRLAPAAERQLIELSDALSRDSLRAFRFEIAGHTDASGAAGYNRYLSEQRANAVMQFLVERGISRDRLVAVGYGEDRLLYENRPNDAGNRRVEIRNLGVANQ